MATTRKCGVCGMEQLYISWSSLRVWEECHAKGRLMQQKKKNPASDLRSFFGGTTVDRVMRDWLMDDNRQPGQMVSMVETIMEREEKSAIETGDGVVRWRHANDKSELKDFCIELVQKLEPILNEQVLPFDFEPAMRFRTPLEIPYLDGSPATIFLSGEMDLLIRNLESDFLIWDLKATKDDNYWKKTIGQLVFYDLSTFSMFEQYSKGGGLIQPMCKEQVLFMTVSEQQRIDLMQRIVTMAHEKWRKEYDPRQDNKYCTYCPVKHACPKFNPVGDSAKRRLSLFQMKSQALEYPKNNSAQLLD